MDNLELYNIVRAVPQEAQKTIAAGKLKGFIDINPMWRIKTLTENFGMCGIGWKPEIVEHWTEPGADGEMTVYVRLNLFVKSGDTWSEAIQSIGGSTSIAMMKGQLRTNDDAYKSAYTDALGGACKLLGIGADIYWQSDASKYGATQPLQELSLVCADCGIALTAYTGENGKQIAIRKWAAGSEAKFGRVLCVRCMAEEKAKLSAS